MKKRDPEKFFFYDHLLKPLVWLTPDFVRPNHVTVFRMVITPVVLWFLFIENYSIGVVLFLFAAFTDAFDGSLARQRKQITKWGTFYDPIADKILVGSVVLLVVIQHVNPIIGAALITVELAIIAGGWYRRQHGRIVTANIWGKVKMFLEVTAVLVLLFALWFGVDPLVELSNGTLILAIVFAIVSLLTYSL